MRGKVTILAIHESRGSFRPSGLIIPETSQFSNRWFGWVVGVGPGVNTLAWGDLVFLARRREAVWFNRPFGAEYSNTQHTFALENPADPEQWIEANGSDKLVVTQPADVVFRVNTWDGIRAGVSPGTHPVSQRVLIRHDPRLEMIVQGILASGLDEWLPTEGEVVEAAPDVEGIEVGQRVYLEHDPPCTRWKAGDHEWSLVPVEYVMAVR